MGIIEDKKETETTFEKLEIPYVERNGLLYPFFGNRNEQQGMQNIGKYGLLWLRYMEENESARYRSLIRFERARQKAKEVNEEAYELLELLIRQYMQRHKLKQEDSTMEKWRMLKHARMQAEEVVLQDIVYRFH